MEPVNPVSYTHLNTPYYGVDFSAGEIGHVVVEADGDKCNCGNYGCLETVASNNNITRKAIKLIKQGVNSSLSKEIDDINNLSIEDICKAANNGDELSITILKEAARYIGIAITNLINILNPTAIVVAVSYTHLDVYKRQKSRRTYGIIGKNSIFKS